MDNTNKHKIEGLDIDTLSDEERIQIEEEINGIFLQSSLAKKDENRFNLSSYPKGIGLPLVLSGILFALFVVMSVGAFLYINGKTQKEQKESISLNAEASDLTQKIIGQNKQALDQTNEELMDIQDKLNNLLGIQGGGEGVSYEQQIELFDKSLQDDISVQEAALRKQLAGERVVEAEIMRRVASLRKKLEQEHDEKLQKIQQLQSDFDTKEGDIQTLQNDIAQREAQNARIESQLSAAKETLSKERETLAGLKDKESNKIKAFEGFSVYHENIVRLMNNNEFVKAKGGIKVALENMARSPYKNDAETLTYRDAYNTYKLMIDSVISAQKILDISSSDIDKLNREKNDQSLESGDLNKKLKDSKEVYAKLKQEYEAFKKNNDSIAVARQKGENTSLENMTEIIGYLGLKKNTGVSDTESKLRIDTMINNNKSYKGVIDSLAGAMDTSF